MAAIGVSERALLGSTQRGKHTHTRAHTHIHSHTRQICKCDADAHSCLLVASHLLYLCVTLCRCRGCVSESDGIERTISASEMERESARSCLKRNEIETQMK